MKATIEPEPDDFEDEAVRSAMWQDSGSTSGGSDRAFARPEPESGLRNSGLSRRMLLRGGAVGGAGLAAVWLAGCDALSTDPAGTDGGGERPEKGLEAPELAELVEAGELPPVEDRLPTDPLVVEPTEGIGVYGGTWRTALNGAEDTPYVRNTMSYDGLVRWTEAWDGTIPNIAESFEVSDDGREYTFRLRPEMKWSDGEPFTADDLVFAYEDLILVPEIASAPPAAFTDPAGETGELEKLDDHTVRFVFANPHGLFLDELAGPDGMTITSLPRHYLEQFHPDYNDDIDDLIAEEGVSSWFELMERHRSVADNPDLPVVYAWQVTTPIGDGQRVIAQRNPYYWKVDPDGSQLPYLNEVNYEIISDPDVMVISATNGELNLHTRHINTPTNRPVLADGRETGDYDFFPMSVGGVNDMSIQFNLNHKDPVLRELFQNKDFRIGLSHAINRDEMVDAVFLGQAEARQVAPAPEGEESAYYDEEFAYQFTEYDVDLANEYLDAAGLTERDSDGFRLLPDGSDRLTFTVEIAVPAPIDAWPPGMELVTSYWAEVGVDAQVNAQDRSIWTALVDANDHDVCVWDGTGGFLFCYTYLPFHSVGSRYALEWALWYETDGENGEEPPEEVKRQLDIYDQVLATPDEAERDALFSEVIEIAKDQFYVLGIAASTESYGIVANNFHNVPESMPAANSYATPGPTRPEQYYIADE